MRPSRPCALGDGSAGQPAKWHDGSGGQVPNLKKLQPDERVQTITHCRDTYRVTTADGKTHAFWERNLRFKTDISEDGPQKGAPAIVAAGMMGDRADVIFAAPEEISSFISSQC
jgi:cytochrome c